MKIYYPKARYWKVSNQRKTIGRLTEYKHNFQYIFKKNVTIIKKNYS